MMAPHHANHHEIEEMRDVGRALSDKGFLELDAVTGGIVWANDHFLYRQEMNLDDLTAMTVFEAIPDEFHDSIRHMMADMQAGKPHRFSIRPILASDGRLVWWYTVRVKAIAPYVWFRCEFLNITDATGPEAASMTAVMTTTNSYNDLYNKLQELQDWTEDQVERLDLKDAELEDRISALVEDVRETKKFAETAANAGLQMNQAMINFQTKVAEELSKHTADIIQLLSTDSIHDKRFDAFEAHVKQTTSAAMHAISQRARSEGRGLATKVTIPVGLISAITIIIQWIMQHWPHK